MAVRHPASRANAGQHVVSRYHVESIQARLQESFRNERFQSRQEVQSGLCRQRSCKVCKSLRVSSIQKAVTELVGVAARGLSQSLGQHVCCLLLFPCVRGRHGYVQECRLGMAMYWSLSLPPLTLRTTVVTKSVMPPRRGSCESPLQQQPQ